MQQHSQNASESAELEVERSSLILPQSENIIPESTNMATESVDPDKEPPLLGVLQHAEYQHEETVGSNLSTEVKNALQLLGLANSS